MTLVAGFRCHEGIVMLSDMEETTSGFIAKRRVDKLRPVDYFAEWMTVIGGSGDSAVVDNATQDLATRLSSIRLFDKVRVQAAIDETLKLAHDKYIDPDPRSEGVSLIIGITEKQGFHLYSTQRRTPQPQNEFAAIGYGADLATYFADRMHSYWLSLDHVVKIAAFVAGEVEGSVRYCGQGGQILVFPQGGTISGTIKSYDTHRIAEELPGFEDMLIEFSQKLKLANPAIMRSTSRTSEPEP